MSAEFCRSPHCRLELEEARTRGKPILLIFKEHVDEQEMSLVIREVFRNFTRAQFVFEDGRYKIQPDWRQICESIITHM